MRRRAFTLVELLTVIAVMSILYAILMPVFLSVKRFAQEYVAGQSMMKLSLAASMYASDNDDTFPLAYYSNPDGSRMNWFGLLDRKGKLDTEFGLIRQYAKGKIQPDASFSALPWIGDETGFGYNWGYLGSDYYLENAQSDAWNCTAAATMSMLGHPSTTIEFGTSSFYYAKWLKDGDGATYRYGYVDPPRMWFGNPTVDFRHMGEKHFDARKHEVTSTGSALLVFVDGHLKSLKQPQVKDRMFERGEPNPLGEVIDPGELGTP